jgi:hypothetical protein
MKGGVSCSCQLESNKRNITHALSNLHFRPDLDASKFPYRNILRDAYRLLDVSRLNQDESAEDFLAFGIRTVGHQGLPAAVADRLCGRRRLQRRRSNVVSLPRQFVVVVQRIPIQLR